MSMELKGCTVALQKNSNVKLLLRPAAACLRAQKFKFMFTILGGRHAMALTVDGKVFSWGEGDDGKLGHFSRM